MSNSNYSVAEIQTAANNIRKNILKLAIDKNGCYLGQACSSAETLAALYLSILNIGESQGSMEPLPFPGVPSPDNMDYPNGALYHGEKKRPTKTVSMFPPHIMHQYYIAHWQKPAEYHMTRLKNSMWMDGIWK